jgi:hypothetical protein
MRRRYQLARNRVQLHNRLEALLEEAHLKLSSLVSDLLDALVLRRAERAREPDDRSSASAASAGDQR